MSGSAHFQTNGGEKSLIGEVNVGMLERRGIRALLFNQHQGKEKKINPLPLAGSKLVQKKGWGTAEKKKESSHLARIRTEASEE